VSERVRIGFGLGTAGIDNVGAFGELVDSLEALRFDSLWLSERVSGNAPDPIVGMAIAAGRTKKLKFGTSVLVVPGRNPFLLAKQLASLDALSNGRLLPAVGLGAVNPVEHEAFGVERTERASMFDEALPLLRRLWTEDDVHHEGRWYRSSGITIGPKPVQNPLEVWMGGRAPSELRRVGRLGDGWLPSFSTPDEVAAGRVVVESAAADAGRQIDPGHFGALLVYSMGPLPDRLLAIAQARRPDVDPHQLFAEGHDGARALIEKFVAVGFSKFVLVPAGEPDSWERELTALAATVLPLQQ
jgi:probable F420-dependent oxidoreductase